MRLTASSAQSPAWMTARWMSISISALTARSASMTVTPFWIASSVLAVGHPACDLVHQAETEPQRQLEDEILPTMGQEASDGSHLASLATVSVRFSPGFQVENVTICRAAALD